MDAISNSLRRPLRSAPRAEELSLSRTTWPSANATRWPTRLPPSACSRPSASRRRIDTRNDPRLSRIFANKVIKIYPAFAEFYGMEDAIEQVVSYFRHAAQGLEERSRSCICSGPVGGGKSSHRRAAEAR